MPYTIYRKVNVLSVENVTQSRRLRPKEIADSAFKRDNFSVAIAPFSNIDFGLTISDFKAGLAVEQLVSLAVNDENQVIAIVNHSSGTQQSLKTNSITISEVLSTLLYLLIPGILGVSLANKFFQTIYHNAGWVVLAIAGGFILFILNGVLKQFFESERALKELLSE